MIAYNRDINYNKFSSWAYNWFKRYGGSN